MKILIFLSIVLGFFLTSMEFSQGANLAIRKSGPSSANPGELVTYTITYSNTVSTLESNVVITDYLPDAANCTYYSSFPSGVYNTVSNTITWNSTHIPGLARLDAGSGENTIQVTLRVGKLGTGIDTSSDGYYLNASSASLVSYADIKSDQSIPSISSNTVSTIVNYDCTFKISQPGAGIKSATGSTLTYLVALTNTGNVSQKYSLGSTLYSGQHLDQFIQDLNSDAISETPFVAPGGTYFFHYVLKTPDRTGTKPDEYTETKITATPNICGDPQEAIYSTYVYGGSYNNYELLSVYKIDTADPIQSGSQLTYKIVISNVGDPLRNVRLEEIYPANTNFLSASTSVSSVTTGNNIWDFAILPTGNTVIEVTLDVPKGLPNGTILNNTVEVSNNGKTYDTYTETTTVSSAPDLSITKTASVVDPPAAPNSIVNYTLTYINHGNYTASDVVIKDNYAETYMTAHSIGDGIDIGGEIRWNIPGSLAPGESGTLHYSMQINDDPLLFKNGSTNIINSAVISSNLPDSNVSDNTATATVNVFLLPDLKIEKTADPAIGLVNQPITYILSVSNIGKLDHAGSTYTVIDYLPAGTTYLSSTPAGGIYNAGTVTWTVSDDLPVDESRSFTVTLDALPCSFVGIRTLTNNAFVNSNSYGDSDNSNNEVVLITDVVDNEIPTIASTDPVYANNDSGKCSAEVTLAVPSTADNCGILTVTNNHPSTTFPVGTTKVTWRVTDIHGNVTTADQNVIVKDVSAPVADVETLATVTGECSVTVTAPTATDNCKGILTGTTTDPLIYSAQGTYIIHWTYDDGNGNTSTQTQTVVVDDVTPPEKPVLADVIVGECSGTPPTPTTTDNCKGTVMGTTSILFPKTKQGKHTIIWTFDDGNGNVTTAYQNLILDDTTAPVADVAALPTVTGECSVTVSAPTATDNCKGILTGITEDALTYSIQGTYTIHWTYDDGNGNISTQTQTVVVDDITPPEKPVLADVIVGECSGTPPTPTTVDNCAGIVTGKTSIIFPKTKQGKSTIVWTFDDGNGNVTSAYQNLIVDDITPPEITGSIAVTSVEGCDLKDVSPAANSIAGLEALGLSVSDACTAKTALSISSSDVLTGTMPKVVTRTYTITDANDNSTNFSQTILLVDTQKPTIICPEDKNVMVDKGKCTASGLALGTPIISDNCSIASVSNDAPEVFAIGSTKITWTVIDASGNITTCSQMVKVKGLPVAVDDNISVNEDDKISGNVMENDEGLCMMSVLVKSHTEPEHGSLTIASDGSYTYTPEDNYQGTDKFTYQICSLEGSCSEATVSITIMNRNDMPLAKDDTHIVQLDLVLQGDVAENDIISGDGGNVWTIVDLPAHGTISFHPDGTYTYTPSADFLGSDSFTYKLCDADGDCSQGKVSIRIEDVLLPNQILTPNGDEVNDTFIIVGIELYPQNKLTMYNRWGNIVYQKNNYQNEWDGNSNVSKIGTKSLPVGTYYYLVDYGKNRHKTGFVYLDR